MSTLKLNQKILASTTCYLYNEFFKLEPTTLVDAYSIKNSKELQIKLGDGLWGACPSRDRNRVVTELNELRAFFDSEIKYKIQEGKFIYLVERFVIRQYKFSHDVVSLKEGNYTVYNGDYCKIHLPDNKLTSNTAFDIEGAYKLLEKNVENYFKY